MSIKRSQLFRGLLLAALTSAPLFLTYGKEQPSFIPITRNLAWNDFVAQISFLPLDAPEDSLDKDLVIIQTFLKAHEREVKVGIYDIELFRAIDRARARLQKADKDLEKVRNELSYKEQRTTRGK